MAAQLGSRVVTDVYRRELIRLRDAATAQVAGLWAGVDPSDIDVTLGPIIGAAGFIITAAQAQAAAMAGVYLSAYMTSELGVVTDIPVPVAQYAGVTQDGRPVSEPLGLAGIAMKLAVIAGATSAGVSAAGLARVVRVARTETMSAARTAQRDVMAGDDRVNGYYRAASGDPCAACMGLAGTQFRDDEVFPIHGACRCTAEPLLAGVPDNHRPQDGKAIYALPLLIRIVVNIPHDVKACPFSLPQVRSHVPADLAGARDEDASPSLSRSLGQSEDATDQGSPAEEESEI